MAPGAAEISRRPTALLEHTRGFDPGLGRRAACVDETALDLWGEGFRLGGEGESREAVVEGALVAARRGNCEFLAARAKTLDAAGGCEGGRGQEERREDGGVAHFWNFVPGSSP